MSTGGSEEERNFFRSSNISVMAWVHEANKKKCFCVADDMREFHGGFDKRQMLNMLWFSRPKFECDDDRWREQVENFMVAVIANHKCLAIKKNRSTRRKDCFYRCCLANIHQPCKLTFFRPLCLREHREKFFSAFNFISHQVLFLQNVSPTRVATISSLHMKRCKVSCRFLPLNASRLQFFFHLNSFEWNYECNANVKRLWVR